MEQSAEHKGRKRWSEQEDQLLRMLVGNGDGAKKKWREVAAHLPGRTDAQCQHRWAKVCGWVGRVCVWPLFFFGGGGGMLTIWLYNERCSART